MNRLAPLPYCLGWMSALSICGLCSCASMGKPAATDPFHSELSRPASRSTHAAPGRARVSNERAYPQQSVARPRNVVQATRPDIQLASNETAPVAPTDGAIERVAADERTPAFCPEPFAAGAVIDDQESSPALYPDEYLFDGGDRAYPITRNAYQYQGLETEDTFAEFEDDEGRSKIKKSNRVAIYAPRFGSVVMTSGPVSDTLVDKVHGHVVAQGGDNLRSKTAVDTGLQNLESGRIQTQLRPTGVGTDLATGSLHRGQGRAVSHQVMNTHEALRRQKGLQFEDRIRPQLMEGMMFAETWTLTQNPIIQGQTISASEHKTVLVQADFTGLEDKGKRGDLYLLKTADKGVAEIGEIVTFTIHYENRGDRELKNVAITDNLTPRLEYIADATSTDRPGKVIAEDNGEGSVVLRFVLDAPLPGRTKGSITFQARVK